MIDVSVVIPTRDRPRQLHRALASVRSQENVELECCVVDDGVPENGGEIQAVVRQFGFLYAGTGGGRGGAVARNVGVNSTNARFIAFLDDDDAWNPGKLQRQLAYMRREGVELSYTGITVVGMNGKRRYSFRRPPEEDQYRSIMRKNFIGTTSTVMVLREAFEAVDGFDPRLPALQDYDLYIRLLRRFRTGWIDAPLTTYYDEHHNEKVSASRERFLTGVDLLRQKYKDDFCYPLLKRSFRHIMLMKCVRSRRFLRDTLRTLLQRGR
jgi:glycosyltransferase involved in cell wall biosynthesis